MSVSLSRQASPGNTGPVGQTFLGFDRGTLPLSFISLALIAVFVVLLPAIDNAIAYEREIEAGDVVDLGSGLSFVPAEGWGFPDGVLVEDDGSGEGDADGFRSAKVTSDGVTLRVTTGPFRGTPDELLAQIRKINDAYGMIEGYSVLSDVQTVTTRDGIVGVSQAFTGVNVDGFITAFVIDGVGVEFVVTGTSGAMVQDNEAVPDMIASLHDSERGED